MKPLGNSIVCVVIGIAALNQQVIGQAQENIGLSRLRQSFWHDPLSIQDGVAISPAFISGEEDLGQRLEAAIISGSLTPECHGHLQDYAEALGGKDIPFWAIKSKLL